MSELILFLPFYLLPFLALFALRRPALLVAGALIAFLVTAVLYRLLAQAGGGESALGGYIAIWVATVGLSAGAAARLAIILLGRRWKHPALAGLVGLLFFFGVPLSMMAWSQMRQEQRRQRYAPPSAECMSRLHHVTLGDRDLRLPLVRGVSIGEGRGHLPRVSTAIPEDERVFCERSLRSKLRVTNVALDFSQLGLDDKIGLRPVCRRPRSEEWWPLLCRFERPERKEIYGIYLFDAGRFDSQARFSFQVETRIGDATPLDARWERVGPLARLEIGHETFWRGPRMPGGASSWSARCYQNRDSAGQADGWRCKAGYLLTPRIALVYDFLTPGDDFEPAAMRIEERASRIARSLIIGGGSVL